MLPRLHRAERPKGGLAELGQACPQFRVRWNCLPRQLVSWSAQRDLSNICFDAAATSCAGMMERSSLAYAAAVAAA